MPEWVRIAWVAVNWIGGALLVYALVAIALKWWRARRDEKLERWRYARQKAVAAEHGVVPPESPKEYASFWRIHPRKDEP